MGALLVNRMDHAQRMRHDIFRNGDRLRTAVADADALVGNLLIGGIVETGVEGL